MKKLLLLCITMTLFSTAIYATEHETTCSNSDGSIVLMTEGSVRVNNNMQAIINKRLMNVQTKSEQEAQIDGETSVHHILIRRNGKDIADGLFICTEIKA